MSRFEIKIAFALLLTAAIPLTVALVLASRLVQESVTVGLNPRVREAVEAQAPVVRDYIRARVAYFKAVASAAAESRALSQALAARDRLEVERSLREILASCLQCTSVELSGGYALRVSGKASFPPQDWAERSFPSEDEPAQAVAGRPEVRLRLTAVVERRYLKELTESGEFARLYALLAEKGDSIQDAYVLAFSLALGITMILATSLGIFLARRVTRRIGVLIEATRRVATGDLGFQIPVRARDEIADLTQSFNKMLADLGESQRRIVYLETIAAWQEIARRLAHEIKNPLTPILLAMQQVHKKYGGEDPKYRKTLDQALEVVTEEVESLRALVSDFSEFAKLPSVHLQPGDLGAFFEEVARGEAAEGLPVTLTRPQEPVAAGFDRMLLRRALTNLLKNAREAMAETGAAGAPELSLSREGDHAVVETADRGPGVPDESKSRVFDPYYTTKHDGTGLGLAIVKKIVLDHGGSITVADRAGGGAVFRIVLPLRPDKEASQR
jgi:nitrogen fixation/metabolism regulation signal transduction histidine kinase